MPTSTRNTTKTKKTAKAATTPKQKLRARVSTQNTAANKNSTNTTPITHESIATRAYFIWEQNPHTNAEANWAQAEAELSQK